MVKNYQPVSIIKKKREGTELTSSDIQLFIQGMLAGEIPDYQVSALLMAIYFRGMSESETAALTDAMLYSGKILAFRSPTEVIDKHSTGGVGDKTSFILAPIAAACGVQVPMIAGRGLGHTGGTVDKIEAIKGFKTQISLKKFQQLVEGQGLALIGQSAQIAPADKMLYALRDVTATVESIPLITASIMSKKLAEGAHGIVMDIKVGNGAFMKDLQSAKLLAASIRVTGQRFNKKVMTFLTQMSRPLGKSIGNSIEIIEAIETLKGAGPKDLTDLSLELAAGMIYLAQKSPTLRESKKLARQALESGQALEKFRQLIKSQGGNPKIIDNYHLLPLAPVRTCIYPSKSGYLTNIDCELLGQLVVQLGGGRQVKDAPIDFGVGLLVHAQIGDYFSLKDPLMEIIHHSHQQNLIDQLAQVQLKKIFQIQGQKTSTDMPLIFEKQFAR